MLINNYVGTKGDFVRILNIFLSGSIINCFSRMSSNAYCYSV